MEDKAKTDAHGKQPGAAARARPDPDAAARYLDLWERHLSLTATAGLKPPERDQ